MAKKQTPECSIVPGMLTGINYAELIKRDANNICEIVNAPKKESQKTKVYSNKGKAIRK